MSRWIRRIRSQRFMGFQFSDLHHPRPGRSGKRLLFAFLLLPSTLSVSYGWAAVLFADANLSSDCTTGNYSLAKRDCSGSDGKAYSTIQKAANVVSPGDTVQVRAGQYRERLSIVASGTASSYITFRNHPAERPLIDGQKTLPSGNGLIFLNNKAYVQIIGLAIVNSKYYGVQASGGSHHILVQDCEVMYSDHGGMVFDGGSNVTIDNCDVHHNNDLGPSAWNEAITLNGVNTFEVKNSRVHNNKEEGIDAKYGASNGKIYNNRVYENNGPNIYVDAASGIDIYNNVVYNTLGSKAGIGLSVETTYNTGNYPTTNIRIFNNVIYNNYAGIWFWIESIASFTYFENIEIVNNVIYGSTSWGGITFLNGGTNEYRGNLVCRNNMFWNNAGGSVQGTQVSKFTVDHNLFKSGDSIYGTNYITTNDVGWIDAANHDFHLQASSPARDKGSTSAAPSFDFDGITRPQGIGVDIGAFEYATGSPAPPSNLRSLP